MNCIARYGRRDSVNHVADHDRYLPSHNTQRYGHVSCCCDEPPRSGRHFDHRTCRDPHNCGWRNARDVHRCDGSHDRHQCANQCSNGGATCIVAVNASGSAQDEHVMNQNQQRHTYHHHYYYADADDNKGKHRGKRRQYSYHYDNSYGYPMLVSVGDVAPYRPQQFPAGYYPPSQVHISSQHIVTTPAGGSGCEALYPIPPRGAIAEHCCPPCGLMDRPGPMVYRHVPPQRGCTLAKYADITEQTC